MSDGIEFRVSIKGVNGVRAVIIITDTIQSAMSIAKARCAWNETVTMVCQLEDDVIIDYSVCKGGKS
jgi:hypothetical protein